MEILTEDLYQYSCISCDSCTILMKVLGAGVTGCALSGDSVLSSDFSVNLKLF